MGHWAVKVRTLPTLLILNTHRFGVGLKDIVALTHHWRKSIKKENVLETERLVWRETTVLTLPRHKSIRKVGLKEICHLNKSSARVDSEIVFRGGMSSQLGPEHRDPCGVCGFTDLRANPARRKSQVWGQIPCRASTFTLFFLYASNLLHFFHLVFNRGLHTLLINGLYILFLVFRTLNAL